MAANEIDPRFFLPPGVVDLGYTDTTQPSSDVPADSDVSVAILDEGNFDIPFDTDNTVAFNTELPPPNSMTVISQTVRVTSGGAVVDVVIDVEDTAGTGQFEVRVTK